MQVAVISVNARPFHKMMLTLHQQIMLRQLFQAEPASPLLTRAHIQFVPCSRSNSPTSKYRDGACKRVSGKTLSPLPR